MILRPATLTLISIFDRPLSALIPSRVLSLWPLSTWTASILSQNKNIWPMIVHFRLGNFHSWKIAYYKTRVMTYYELGSIWVKWWAFHGIQEQYFVKSIRQKWLYTVISRSGALQPGYFFEFLPSNNQTSHNPIVGLNSGLVYYQLIQSQFGTWNSAEIAI